ncbi:hypothetical protein [Curtobacterium poinsettiae]|uniref:hypothetical protein n=1 Tax=Curtobacterium poinsettiae TaxID=159612 RepID=UPI00217E91B9|nr:hypothetical protein [Curtobacterium flaccumfaciens]MCS6578274.1 hypothetical protein [Curtobacterium flaccumfaciens]
MTPERYRALADELQSAAAIDFGVSGDTMFAAQSALRAAADQLEAVRAWVDEHHHHFAEISELAAVLDADTAPHEYADGGPIPGGRIWAAHV